MFHRSITRIAGAAVLGAGLMLGGALPALAQDTTGPDSEACAAATAERQQLLDRAQHLRDKGTSFDEQAAEHEQNAEAADELATQLQSKADAADAEASEQQAIADEAAAEAARWQNIADTADANGEIEKRDNARAAAQEARDKRDAARDAAEAARSERDQARQDAQAARGERDSEREAAAKDRKQRDNRHDAADSKQAAADAVDMSVCDEPPADDDKQPGDNHGDQGQQDNTPPADKPVNTGENDGGTECDQAGKVHESGRWVWNCGQWVPVEHDTDDGVTPKGGVDTGDGGTENLAYTGAPVGWMLAGAGLLLATGVGFLTVPLLRRSQ